VSQQGRLRPDRQRLLPDSASSSISASLHQPPPCSSPRICRPVWRSKWVNNPPQLILSAATFFESPQLFLESPQLFLAGSKGLTVSGGSADTGPSAPALATGVGQYNSMFSEVAQRITSAELEVSIGGRVQIATQSSDWHGPCRIEGYSIQISFY